MSLIRQLQEIYNLPILYKGKLLQKFRLEWKTPTHKWRDFSKIEEFFKLTCMNHKRGTVDDKTWYDLGMNSIFNKIDTTLTEVGQQTLYRKMRLLETDSPILQQQYHFAKVLHTNQELREELQTAIYPLSLISANTAVKLLFEKFHFISLPKLAIACWTLISLATLLCTIYFANTILYLSMLLIVIVNFFLSRKFLAAIEKNAYGLHCISRILSVSHSLAVKKNYRRYRYVNTCQTTYTRSV